ncbi:MAG: hypothetical protein AAF628_29955 [Planctomycetota bacterium]
MQPRARAAFSVLLLTSAVASQPTWESRGGGQPPAYAGFGLAFDAARDRLVVSGGDGTTWERGGERWIQHFPARVPPGNAGQVLVYDSTRARALVYGGVYTGSLNPEQSLLSWNGADWDFECGPCPPGGLLGHAMAEHRGQGQVLLFGGDDAFGTAPAETWVLDRAGWSARRPKVSPAPRIEHAMAYDPERQRIVLFGGLTGGRYGGTPLGDTWEWDGAQWTEISTPGGPRPRNGHAMAWDGRRGRVMLYGGLDASSPLADQWEWDGARWAPVAAAVSPGGVVSPKMTWDSTREQVILLGQAAAGTHLEAWHWDGTVWQQAPVATPFPRRYQRMAYDQARDRTMLFGGRRGTAPLADTWEWNGRAWRLAATSGPSPRFAVALTYDAARENTVLFGGTTYPFPSAGWLGETWQWDGGLWQQALPATSPSPRGWASMAYDVGRNRVVMFGGYGPAGPLDETWEWDGRDWRRIVTSSAPSARGDAAIAYDAARQRIVLVGGSEPRPGGPLGRFRDTWEYDGVDWVERFPTRVPPASFYATTENPMVYDAQRARVVLLAFSRSTGQGETWEWDGTDWMHRAVGSSPPMSISGAMVYDTRRAQLVMAGGASRSVELQSTWIYATDAPARFDPYGAGCAGTAGVPALGPVPFALPWDDAPFVVQADRLPASAPAALLLSTSATRWQSLALPAALDALGMPGCSLLAGADLVLPGAATAGRATWTVPVTGAPVGTEFYSQAYVLDAGANPLGVTMSNGAAAVIGAR